MELYYAVIAFDSKKDAEKFAYEQKTVSIEIKAADDLQYGHMYKDVEVVMSEYMNLTEEQRQQVDVAAIVDELFDYDYSNYKAFIASKIDEQLTESAEG